MKKISDKSDTWLNSTYKENIHKTQKKQKSFLEMLKKMLQKCKIF